jgi:hypothetical protein
VFDKQGSIEGQRAPLRTKSAIEIRKRLVADIENGAVIPPLVIGLLISQEIFTEINTNSEKIKSILNDIDTNAENLSLIDGMQRTAALRDALDKNNDLDSTIRIELWVATNINSLIYRMLVLNTAQIPWSVKRQLEVIYSSLNKSIVSQIPEITLFKEEIEVEDQKQVNIKQIKL